MTSLPSAPLPVVVVGAGIAGLVCARALHHAGRPVLVLERATEIGGRVRTRTVDGYTIDRGFQVLFTAYPTLSAALGIAPGGDAVDDGAGSDGAGADGAGADGRAGGADDGLALRRFEPAAQVVCASHASYVGDALRAPAHDPLGALRSLMATAAARALPTRDKLRMLALRRLATSLAIDDCFAERFDDLTAREFLAQQGFTDRTVARFFAPFYGGILLDPTLGTSASLLLFTFKMMAEGDVAVPAGGMGVLARRLAAALPSRALRTNAHVTAVTAGVPAAITGSGRPGLPGFPGGAGRRATGVVLANGQRIDAAAVVLATPLPVTEQLAASVGVALNVPDEFLGATTLYFAAAEAPLPGRAIWLNAAGHERNHDQPAATDPWPALSHAVTLTEVAPEYAAVGAPHGRHLLAANAVGAAAALDDDALTARVLAELAGMRRAAGLGPMPGLVPVAVERVAYAQYAQPPGVRRHRVPAMTPLPGLWCATEGAHSSSLEGAARGGQSAAMQVLAARG